MKPATLTLVKLLCFAATIWLSGCATTPSSSLTKQEVFPEFYSEKPSSILVLPAINNSTAADAGILYSATIAEPLSKHGYYVLPVPITDVMLQEAGIGDGAQLLSVPPAKFGQMFGADSILFVTIESWDTSYYVVGGNVTVGLQFRLVSTKTGERLWSYRDEVRIDTSGNGNNGLIGALIETAINTSQQDYFPIAQQVNDRSINVLPHGKFHPNHETDATSSAQATHNAPEENP